jgi:NADPH:quinone reductase-like Zn-dependent oxidoreductase
MAAVVRTEYGSVDVVRVADVPIPRPTDDQVLVRVHAAGIDHGVWHIMAGLPRVMRVAGYGLRRPKQPVLGSELAGTVVATGSAVTALRVGDEVYGACAGSFAEYAVARPRSLAPKPAGLSFEQAAAVPISALTALQALRDHGRLQAGQRVLVVGASGGVGTYAVQIAKAMGADVTGVCSTAKIDLVRSLGADRVIDHQKAGITDDGARYDLVLDIGGNRSIRELRRTLTERGTLVIVGGEGGGTWFGMGRQLRAVSLSPFIRQRLVMFVARTTTTDLTTLTEMIDAGSVAPAIDRRVPLSAAADAIRDLHDGRVRGKVVVLPHR